jgi:hypothetical protein
VLKYGTPQLRANSIAGAFSFLGARAVMCENRARADENCQRRDGRFEWRPFHAIPRAASAAR